MDPHEGTRCGAAQFLLMYLTGAKHNPNLPRGWDERFDRCCEVLGDALIQFQPGSGYDDVAPIVLAVKSLRDRPAIFGRVIPALVRHAGPENITAAIDVASRRHDSMYMARTIRELVEHYHWQGAADPYWEW